MDSPDSKAVYEHTNIWLPPMDPHQRHLKLPITYMSWYNYSITCFKPNLPNPFGLIESSISQIMFSAEQCIHFTRHARFH